MGMNCVVLTEVKITNNKYPRCASGLKVISSKATSHTEGGVPYCGMRVMLLLRLRQ
jgi:hypothetical protein